MSDADTRVAIATLLDERLRASYILENHGITIPATHGHDELLPFWMFDDMRPSDQESLKRARGRPDGADDAPFLKQDVVGSPGVLGCGYLGLKIVSGGSPSTAEPGPLGGDKNIPINLELWIYTPSTRSTEILDDYTGAFRRVLSSVYIGDKYLPAGSDVLWIDQLQPIGMAQPRRNTPAFKETLFTVPLLRRERVM